MRYPPSAAIACVGRCSRTSSRMPAKPRPSSRRSGSRSQRANRYRSALPIAARCRPKSDRFFDKFASAGKTRGSGLGTYSAKLLTEAQKGRIGMRTCDETNQTTIVVALPPA